MSLTGRGYWPGRPMLCIVAFAFLLGCSCTSPQAPEVPRIALATVWRQALSRTQIVYGVGDRVYSCASGGVVSVLDAATGAVVARQDIDTPDTSAFQASERGVFISDSILAPSKRPGFAWFDAEGAYRGRIVLPDETWIPSFRFRLLGDKLYWCTIDGDSLSDPSQYHGFVELDLDLLIPRSGGDWEGLPRVIWQISDPKRYEPRDFEIDAAGDYYLSLYEHSKRLDPSLPDGKYAAKIVKLDGKTEEELWSFQLHESELRDDGDAFLRIAGEGLLAWTPDRMLRLSLDGAAERDLSSRSISSGALLVGDLLYNAGGFEISCIDTRTLAYRWKTEPLLTTVGAPPALHDGVIYSIQDEGIYCYEATTGRLIGVDRSYDKGLIMAMSWANTVTWNDLLIATDGDSVFAVRMDVRR